MTRFSDTRHYKLGVNELDYLGHIVPQAVALGVLVTIIPIDAFDMKSVFVVAQFPENVSWRPELSEVDPLLKAILTRGMPAPVGSQQPNEPSP